MLEIAKEKLPGRSEPEIPRHELGGLTCRLKVSRRRRTVGLTVTATGELVVQVPAGMTSKALREVVARHRPWILKKQAERRAAWARLEDGKLYYRGAALTPRLITGAPAAIRVQGDFLLVTRDSPRQDSPAMLLAWYRQQAAELLTARVRHFAGDLPSPPQPVEVRDWRRRWGECHTHGKLRFNWRLILLPPDILDYVVVHELAHLKVPGHPPRFWREVARHLPDYASRRRWLKLYGSPFLLWQPSLPLAGGDQGPEPPAASCQPPSPP